MPNLCVCCEDTDLGFTFVSQVACQVSTFPVLIFIRNRCGMLIPEIICERLRFLQSPRTRPGYSATHGYTHQLRGRRARAAHSITAVAIAFHATRRQAASGNAPLGGPT